MASRGSQVEGITIYFEGNSVEFDKTVDGMKKALNLLKTMTSTYMKEYKKTGDINKFAQAIGTLAEQQTAATKKTQAWADEVAKLVAEGKTGTTEYKKAVDQWKKSQLELTTIGIKLEENLDLLREFTDTAPLGKLNDFLHKTGEELQTIGDKATNAGEALKPLSDIAQKGLKAATEQAISFESAFADVQKTVNASEYGFQMINSGLRDLAKEVPTTVQDLAKIAGLAGQMNVPVDQIVDFTRAMVDFGNSTNIVAEDAVQDIAQIYNVIGKGSDFSTLDNLLSTIVELGNNTATTEKDIVEMFTNIAAASSRVKMTEAQMAALAATLSSLNLDKGGASAISKILTNIDMAVSNNGKTLSTWADTADMSVSKFKKLWSEDAAAALTAVLQGMSGTVDEGGSLNRILDELGIKEIRQVDTLSRLVNAQEAYTTNIQLANAAYTKHTALSDEAAKRYKTVESRIQILKNVFNDFMLNIGNLFLPIINKGIDILIEFGEWLNNLGTNTEGLIAVFLAVTSALSPLLLKVGEISGLVGGFLKDFMPKLLLNGQTLIKTITSLGTTFTNILLPIGAVIAILVDLYTTNEEFKQTIDVLIETIGVTLKSTIELIIAIFELLWAIIKKVIEIIIKLWNEFKTTIWGKIFIQIIQDVINVVKDCINFVNSLIQVLKDAVSWFMTLIGLQSKVSSSGTAGMRVGRGEIAPDSGGFGSLNSGGFMSGGITLNANFTVNSNNISRADVKSWSSWIVDDLNEALGKQI